MTEETWTDVIDEIGEHMISGHSINQFGNRKYWTKLKTPLWITHPIRKRWDMVGFSSVPTSKLEEIEDLTEEYFREAVNYIVYSTDIDKTGMPEATINWILGPIAEIMNERKIKGPLDLICPSESLKIFLEAMYDNKFNKSKGKEAFRDFIKNDFDISNIIADEKYKLADASTITDAINKIIAANPDKFEQAKVDQKLINWLVGQVMKEVAGKAKAPDVRDALLKRINE